MEKKTAREDFFRFKIRVWGLITAAGAIAGAASVLGFFGWLHWALDLLTHFRVQYCLGLGVVALLLLIPGKRRLAALFGLLAVVNLGVILPLFFGKDVAALGCKPSFRVMLLNVNTANENIDAVADVIRRYWPDVLVLEEVNEKWLSGLKGMAVDYGYSTVKPRDDNFGIALFSKFPLAMSRIVDIGSADVPSIVAEIVTPQGRCTIIATHPLPPAGSEYSRWRNNQLEGLPHWVKTAMSPVLLVGDLNVSPWSSHFKRLLRESGLRDSTQGRGVCPTWPVYIPLIRIPIDHCLYAQGIGIVERVVGPDVGSDHYPLIVDVVIGDNGRGGSRGK